MEDFLGDVNLHKSDYNFNVYIIRMWNVPTKYNSSEVWYVELILQDNKEKQD
ncbi:hypothetical protein PIB30_089018 [Stylosanthes scabra]|uniref:Uncharacterized protein n=1 Tax=Stylosanthes scabra TaxID=79078 RepID=A0ABU6RTS7_9FABA|nr:hypothetical protein [Stylosanthes scabra]